MTYRDIPGWFDFGTLYESVAERAKDGDHLVEVGVWLGKSISFLADYLKRLGKNVRLDAVDTWKGTLSDEERAAFEPFIRRHGDAAGTVVGVFEENMRACGVADIVRTVQKLSVEAAGDYGNQSLDFVFIDADHRYDAVKEDIAAWWPKIKPGGSLAGHDYTHTTLTGVRRAVDEEFGDRVRQVGSCWVVEKKPSPHRIYP